MDETDRLQTIDGRKDGLDTDGTGMLCLGGVSAGHLVSTFGSPLFVTNEDVIRDNVHRLRSAFETHWPAQVELFFAIKTNNNRAIRAILNSEHVGGECFGEVEYRATLDSGLPGTQIVLNGSDKTEASLKLAIENGSVVNIDSHDELALLETMSNEAAPVSVNIRLRLAPKSFDRFEPTFFKSTRPVSEVLNSAKWGFSAPEVMHLVKRITASDRLVLLGFSGHVGRFSSDPDVSAGAAAEMARMVKEVHSATGFWPEVLDLGGGWPRHREPESRQAALNPHDIAVYAKAVTTALRRALEGPLPRLWLEPGRYLVGNAVTLLTRVTTVRKDVGRRWIHVDASTNLLMRIETSQSCYHILPASRMNAPSEGPADIVGPTCVPSVFGRDREMPSLQRGDVLAIPDAGMYAEVLASQFNGMPLPAGILVGPGGEVEEIRHRETYEDVFRHHVVPARLRAEGARS